MGGSSANVAQGSTPQVQNAIGTLNSGQDPQVLKLLQGVQNGGLSLQDALSQAGGLSAGADPNGAQRSKLQQDLTTLQNANYSGDEAKRAKDVSGLQAQLNALPGAPNSGALQQGAVNALRTDPITGQKIAADQVQNGALTKGLFGQGGIQDQAQGNFGKLEGNLDESRNALMGKDQSYGLTPQDLAAYGQGSANISRMFSGQQQGLAQQLAARGLGAGDSGAANASFAGSYGNQMEQLAGLQQQISQQRIQTAQGLAQARNQSDLQRQAANNGMIQGLGGLGAGLQQQQYQNQVGKSADDASRALAASGAASQNQQLQQNVNNSQWSQDQSSQFNLGNALGGVVGAGLGAVTGGLGTALGSSLSKSVLGGASGGSNANQYGATGIK